MNSNDMSLCGRLEAVESQFLKFDRVESPEHSRPDVCAFLLLHRLDPRKRDMVAGAEHDIIYLDADPETVNAAASDADILTLVRCGVMYDEETDGLAMFV